MKFFDYAERLTIQEENKDFSGISLYPDILKVLKADENMFNTYKIPGNEEYRPDKIAFTLYQNPDSSWILDAINDFSNGISEYYTNRIIIYPQYEALANLGII